MAKKEEGGASTAEEQEIARLRRERDTLRAQLSSTVVREVPKVLYQTTNPAEATLYGNAGGVLVSIRKGHVRGILDEDELDVLPPDASREDRLTHEEFEAVLEAARAEAAHRVERIRAGDVRHDPRNATVWDRFCEYGGICRVAR